MDAVPIPELKSLPSAAESRYSSGLSSSRTELEEESNSSLPPPVEPLFPPQAIKKNETLIVKNKDKLFILLR
jgi:hypothetical protein